MRIEEFIEKNKKDLDDFIIMSHDAANRIDYIQGGGGNTSVKLSDNCMAIKASGYSLAQIERENAYAVLDYETIREFYQSNLLADFEDVEAAGSEQTKKNVVKIDGLKEVRPSVEAGFHALLGKFVLHTHSAYANLLACCTEGERVFDELFAKSEYGYAFVPYVNPGAKLTFIIQSAIDAAKEKQNKEIALILMQNHGIIVNAETGEKASQIHEYANTIIAEHFGLKFAEFPEINVAEVAGKLESSTPWLTQRLAGGKFDADFFIDEALYPDQLVFLANDIEGAKSDEAAKKSDKKACISYETGTVFYNCNKTEALVIEQTLVCVMFIVEVLAKQGYTLQTIDAAGKGFISNWESESYRKSILK